MYGNVGEWCFDFYGDYGTASQSNPTGAAAEQNTALYNVGIRLVCSADDSVKGAVSTTEIKSNSAAGVKKALIVYYSWGGNTRGVAKEIARQTGFDSIELELVTPYSTNYNTVLSEVQRDQCKQDRLALKTKIAREKWAEYDTIILGYPNWWASISMPIAPLFESYDFSGKRILPNGRYGAFPGRQDSPDFGNDAARAMGGSYHTESQVVRGIIPREIFRTQNYADCCEYGAFDLRAFFDDERTYDGVVCSA